MFHAFKGGIHPPLRTERSAGCRLENLSIPQICYIQLQQHTGDPALPVVKPGDAVSEGQIIATANGENSSHVHASVPGRVSAITESPSVFNCKTAIIIEAEGSFSRTGHGMTVSDWSTLSGVELAAIAKDSGLASLGGGPFPSDLTGGRGQSGKTSLLIVNATSGEPYLTADDMVIKTFPDEVVEGIRIALKILAAAKAVIVIEQARSETIRLLEDALKRSGCKREISIKKIASKYPSGSDRQIIYGVTGRIIRGKEQPCDTGISLQGVATIFALREAVVLNKPLIERYITVAGDLIKKPGNYKMRIGTKIADIIDECGGLIGEPARIVAGGAMTGISLDSTDFPVTKSMSALLFLSKRELRPGQYDICIKCGRCVKVCPSGLVPCKIADASEKGRVDKTGNLHAEMCIMCGSCSYICPANRPLTHFINALRENAVN